MIEFKKSILLIKYDRKTPVRRMQKTVTRDVV